MNKKYLYLATTSISIITALSASAFTLNSGKVENITANDINKSFTIRFNGTVEEFDVLGLSSEANFKLTRFTTSDQQTTAAFDVMLKNTSSNGIKSRVSVLGFNVNQPITSASSTGIFNTSVLDGSLPNQLGNLDVCVNGGGNQNNCKNSSGGVKQGQSDLFSLEIVFDPDINELELADFTVRYQGIKGIDFGTKGIGTGTAVEVPEPSTNAALALLTVGSLGWLSKKKKK